MKYRKPINFFRVINFMGVQSGQMLLEKLFTEYLFILSQRGQEQKSTTYSRHGSDEVEQVPLEIFSTAANDSTANHHMHKINGRSKKTHPTMFPQGQVESRENTRKGQQKKQQDSLYTISTFRCAPTTVDKATTESVKAITFLLTLGESHHLPCYPSH